MRTSAPGPTERRAGPALHRGFSLLELLVVLVIIGVATTLVGVNMMPRSNTQADLRREALRLAQLFPVAQAQARGAGLDVLWEADAEGYRFRHAPSGLILPAGLQARAGETGPPEFGGGDLLRPRAWPRGMKVEVALHPASAARFSGEWMPDAMQITLRHAGHQVVIQRDAAGRYEVGP